MRRDPRSTLTPAQRAIFDSFAREPGAVGAGELPAAVLRALEDEYRPTASIPATKDLLIRPRHAPPGELLTAADAAQFLGISLNTFARSVVRAVPDVIVDGRRLYRRADLESWKAQRFANRKRPPTRFR